MLSSDIVVFGYPKAGNTGLARLIRTARSGIICNFPGEENWIDSADKGEGEVRVYKTHNASSLNKATTIVYVIREPIAMSLSGFYHNKPWLKGARIMNTIVGDLMINLYLLVYGCRWPGLDIYKNHFKIAKGFNATVLRYENIWTGKISKEEISSIFLSLDNYRRALVDESKQKKQNQFHLLGDVKSAGFLKEYKRTAKIYLITKKILKTRSGEIWNLYHD